MKSNKLFLLAILSTLVTSLLVGCNSSNNNNKSSTEPEDVPLEIGDTVKEWTNDDDFEESPIDVEDSAQGTVKITDEIGEDDSYSLECDVKSEYVESYAAKNLYFTEDDAKNGDIISLYFYLPKDHNVATIQLEALSISNFETTFYGGSSGDSIKAKEITIDDSKEEKWIRTELSYDTLETLGSIRFNFTRKEVSKNAHFYLDVINITLGEETVQTGYKYNDESLYYAFEDYFKVGTCMSATMLRNTTLRKILVNDFNSVTAENEGKPEQILDQAACQEAAKKDKSNVVITTKPFEKLYDFAEAHHIGVRHHTFVWYSQTPSWFFKEDYTNDGKTAGRELMLKRMRNYIGTTIETLNDRWPGLVYAIDVANEAIDNGIRKNNNNWYTTVGEDFVARAFEYAYEFKDEDQELYYNDYSFDYNQSNCEFAVNTLLTEPIQKGWIDGVGIQGHIDDDQNMDVVINDAKMIKEKGLKCQITELDIETRGNGDNKWIKQKDAYKLLTKRVLESNEKEETDINAFVVWGITDNLSWKRQNNPLLFDQDYAKKPAYYGMLEALEEFEQA